MTYFVSSNQLQDSIFLEVQFRPLIVSFDQCKMTRAFETLVDCTMTRSSISSSYNYSVVCSAETACWQTDAIYINPDKWMWSEYLYLNIWIWIFEVSFCIGPIPSTCRDIFFHSPILSHFSMNRIYAHILNFHRYWELTVKFT